MNGRVYDPTIGRFMSVDPLIPDLADSQSVNPYTYVGNNPLSYIDPSGFSFFKKLMKIVGIAMSIWMPQFSYWWQQALWTFASGYLQSGGNLKAGLLAVATLGMRQTLSGLPRGPPAGTTPPFNPNGFSARVSDAAVSGAERSANSKIAEFFVRSARAVMNDDASARTNRDRKAENGAISVAYEEVQARKFQEKPDWTNRILLDDVVIEEIDGVTFIKVSATARSDRFVTESDARQYFAAIEAYWSGTGSFEGRQYSMTVNIEYLGPTGAGRSADLFLTGVSGQRIGYSNPSFGAMGVTSNEYPSTPAHEFGHVLGLEHRWSQNSIMNDYRFDNSRGVTGYDYSRVAELYGK